MPYHVKCIVSDCVAKNVTLHAIPRNPERRLQWVNFVTRNGTVPKNIVPNTRVCSSHFTNDCFHNFEQKFMGFCKVLFLKPNSVPSLYPDDVKSADSFVPGKTMDVGCQSREPSQMRDVGCQHYPRRRTDVRAIATQLSEGTLKHKRSVAIQVPSSRKSVGVEVDLELPVFHPPASTPIKPPPPKRAQVELTPDSSNTSPTQADSSYDPSSPGLGDSTTEVLFPSTVQNMPKYTVYEGCLLQLFEHCPVCTQRCDVRTFVHGTFLSVVQKCSHCCFHRQWSSRPLVSSSTSKSALKNRHNRVRYQRYAAIVTQGKRATAISQQQRRMEMGAVDAPGHHKTRGRKELKEKPSLLLECVTEPNTYLSELMAPKKLSMTQRDHRQTPTLGLNITEGDGDVIQPRDPKSCDQQAHQKDGPFHCSECGESFSLSGTLKEHQRTHARERKDKREKPYLCTHCGKTFHHSEGLKLHERIHTGEMPFECSECGKSFRQRVALKSHQRMHTGEMPYLCSECGKTFRHSWGLKSHQRIHTGEKPYKCSQCEKTFGQLISLKLHWSRHTGEKPHHCSQCGKNYLTAHYLKIHQRIHTGERPYHCSQCGKTFYTLGNLKKHQIIHSG